MTGIDVMCVIMGLTLIALTQTINILNLNIMNNTFNIGQEIVCIKQIKLDHSNCSLEFDGHYFIQDKERCSCGQTYISVGIEPILVYKEQKLNKQCKCGENLNLIHNTFYHYPESFIFLKEYNEMCSVVLEMKFETMIY